MADSLPATPAPDPAAPVPSTTTPAANGVSPPPEQKPQEAKPPTEDDKLSKLQAANRNLAKARMQFAHDTRKREEELAARAAELERREKELESKHKPDWRNPQKVLETGLGPKWRDAVAQIAMTGEATPGMVASELDAVRAEHAKQLADVKADYEKRFADLEQKALQREQEDFDRGALRYIQTNQDKYPLVTAFGAQERIAPFIHAHFQSTSGQLDEDGNELPGEVLTYEKAAEMMEKQLADAIARSEQLRKPQAGTQTQNPSGNGTSPRRTLSTELNGTSRPELAPAKDDAERRQRAYAAADAIMAQRTRH